MYQARMNKIHSQNVIVASIQINYLSLKIARINSAENASPNMVKPSSQNSFQNILAYWIVVKNHLI
jgi:hypothetical protein